MGSSAKLKQFLFSSLFFLFLCIIGFFQIKEKAGLPFTIESKGDNLVISNAGHDSQLQNNDILLLVDNHNFSSAEEIEVLTDGKKQGEKVEIKYIRRGKDFTAEIILTNYYAAFELITYLISAVLFLFIALITVFKSNNGKAANLFYWGCSGSALIIIMTAGSYTIFNEYIGFLTRFIFHLSYCVTPVIFVHFILNFPYENESGTPFIIKVFYLFAILLAVILTFVFIQGVVNNSTEYIKDYVWIYDNVLRVFVIINFLGAVARFVYSYKKIKSTSDRKKLKWILFGFILGPLSYIFFWVFPYLVFSKGLLPEFLVISLLASVPVTFAIAIVKYHLFDIDFIINRSVVYLAVFISLASVYIILFTTISLSIQWVDDTIPAVISVSAAAILLQPAREQIQKFVDKKFFKVQYNYREALKTFLDEIDSCLTMNSIADKIVKRVNEIIPVEKIGFFELQLPDNKIKLLAHFNFGFLQNRSVNFKRNELKTELNKPVALPESVGEGVEIEKADIRVFTKWGIVLVFPFRSVQNEIFGFLVLGKKKSGFRFTIEDIDLLNAVRSKVATIMERNKYQEELLREHLERERLEELNKMKSFIVSRVSHDFRTPLSTISMFSDLLRNSENISGQKFHDYLKIIEGESNRLKIMVENVLDFSKIEKGSFEYTLEKINLNNLVDEVLNSMQYQLKMNKFTLYLNLCSGELNICADRIGIEAVLINLISNSIKYSADKKVIKISTGFRNGYTFVSIEDEGIGISKDDINNIFNPFLRGQNIDARKIRGAGLGLSIVKHIMDAHNGKIEVTSEPGKGSGFVLLFPRSEIEEIK